MDNVVVQKGLSSLGSLRSYIKRYLHFAGGALGAAGVLFVAARLNKYSAQISVSHFLAREWFAITLLACIYGASNIFLALAWEKILAHLRMPVNSRWAIHIYGISLLAKYIPGNIFQFASRQAIGMAAGMAARPLLQSTVYELAMLAVVGAVFGILVFPLVSTAVTEWGAFLIFSGALAAAGLGLARCLSRRLALTWALHGLFLAVSGLIFWGILAKVSHESYLPLVSICGAYVLAWLAGLVTPGAPAGVGIREAVLLFLLGAFVPQSDLVLAVVIGRIVTVVGDLIFSGFCFGIKRSQV